MSDSKTTPLVHICVGTNRKFVVCGVYKGCRKTKIISSHRSYRRAGERAGRAFTFGTFKRIWVNMIADYYDAITLMTLDRP